MVSAQAARALILRSFDVETMPRDSMPAARFSGRTERTGDPSPLIAPPQRDAGSRQADSRLASPHGSHNEATARDPKDEYQMNATGPRFSRPALGVLAGIGLAGTLAGCAAAGGAAAGSGTPASGAVSYKDGSYSGSGDYQTPGGQESIDVRVTLKADRVTAITVIPKASGGNAKLYQTAFASGISDKVVGKRIDALTDVTRVSGSSLTSGGFQKAISQIESLAKA